MKYLQKQLENLGLMLNINEKRSRFQELGLIMNNDPEFYKKPDLLKEYNRLHEIIIVYDGIADDIPYLDIALDEEEYETEYKRLEAQLFALKTEAMFVGKYDNNNVILNIHAGAGGKEAQDWVGMLMRMYQRWAESKGFNCRCLDFQTGEDVKVFKHVTLSISGERAYGLLKNEAGVHRLIRVSPYDSQGRRHTSFAAVDVIPEIENDMEITLDPKDYRIDTYRASGAGGQHINRTDSAVRITHFPTNTVITCQSERSQIQNREKAMKVLISKLIAIKEQEHLNTIADIKGEEKAIEWGNQIRSYIFMPQQQVKDHRTNYETSDVFGVLDGKINDFIYTSLMR